MLWKIRKEQRGKNMFVGSVRGRRMRSRKELFEQFGALLQFPDYFGENWNAFADCIGDLEWLNVSGCLLVILDANVVLADADSDEFEVLIKILATTGESWSRGDPFPAAEPVT